MNLYSHFEATSMLSGLHSCSSRLHFMDDLTRMVQDLCYHFLDGVSVGDPHCRILTRPAVLLDRTGQQAAVASDTCLDS